MKKPILLEQSRISVLYMIKTTWLCPWFKSIGEAEEYVRTIKKKHPTVVFRYLKLIGYD